MGHDWTTRGRNTAHALDATRAPDADAVVTDRRWASDLRAAVFCSAALFALIMLVDFAGGTLSAVRTGLWAGLGALLYVILHPARVSAGPGWLAVRGPVALGIAVKIADGGERFDHDVGRVDLEPDLNGRSRGRSA